MKAKDEQSKLKMWKTKRACSIFILTGEMATNDDYHDPELHGVHQIENKLIWKHYPFLLR